MMRVFINFVITLMLFSCNDKQSNKVTIYGNKNDFKRMSYSYYNGANSFSNIDFKTTHGEPEKLILEIPDSINRFGSIRTDKGRINVFLSSGDSVNVRLDSTANSNLIISGDNSPQYRFYNQLRRDDSENPTFDGNFELFAYKINSKYNLRKKILYKYIKKNHVSEDFSNFALKEFRYDYLNGLLTPMLILKLDTVDLPLNYLKGIEDSWFDDPSLFNSRSGSLAVIKNIHLKNNGFTQDRRFSSKLFLEEIKYIKARYKGEPKNIAILLLVDSYLKNLDPETIPLLKNELGKIEPTLQSILAKNFARSVSKRLGMSNNALPPNVATIQLLDLKGENQNFDALLKSNLGKKIILDIWASWCFPCLEEMEKTVAFRKRISEAEDVEWIFLSVDQKNEDWQSKIKEKENLGIDKNQYIISKKEDIGIFYNYFFIAETGIPRYLIFDSENKLVLPNAVRSIDSTNFKKQLQKIK